MTTKEYKKMCRIKINRLGKFLTWLALVTFFAAAEYVELSGYVTAIVGTSIWFYMPDVVVYILETTHKLKHDFVSWR